MTKDRVGNPNGEAEESEPSAAPASPRRSWLGALAAPKWLATLLVVSLAGHGMGYAYHRLSVRARDLAPQSESEVSLGAFRFAVDKTEGALVSGAQFSLHVGLLEDMDRAGRDLLAQRRFRIQEAVEELLRQAHGGDFEDPSLAALKRKIQQQINECLGVRVVEDVIITDLKLQWNPEARRPAAETAEWLPGTDPPAEDRLAHQPPEHEAHESAPSQQ